MIVLLACSLSVHSQTKSRINKTFSNTYIPDARNMPSPPVFPFGRDSLQRFYFSHFTGFDSLLRKAITNGDTAKYLRVYFSYIIDVRGRAYNVQFDRVGAAWYVKAEGARTLYYFNDDKKYFESKIKEMMHQMPSWKPGLLRLGNTQVITDARVHDYVQCWVGIKPPAD